MIIKYLRRKNDYDLVNVRNLQKAVDLLKEEDVNEALNILKSVVRYDYKVGVLVGFEENGIIHVGWSKYNDIEEYPFDKEFGKAIAVNRAVAFEDKFKEIGFPDPESIPYIVRKELPEFVDRCLRYYKDKKPSEWIFRYLDFIN